jgi:hypothetical protein
MDPGLGENSDFKNNKLLHFAPDCGTMKADPDLPVMRF